MKKLKKVLIGLLTCLTVGTATVGMAACNVGLSPDGNGGVNIEVSGNQPTSSEGKEDTNVKLAVPTNIRVDETNVLRWNSVDNASSYIIVIDEQEYERNVLACDLTKILKYNGRYEIYIKAKTNDSTKVDGDFSEPFFFDYEDGIEKTDKTEVGTFGQFEDLFTQEAYIGYGYDVINSSYVNSREVKTNYPIFDRNQLMGKRLLMTNERETQDEYISDNSLESYQQKVEAKLSTKIKAGKVFSGSLGAKYAQTTESTASALFYEYRHSTVAYTLVLQCDFNEYREMLTDAFKRDLMTLDAGTLFQRYGTHVITSALMGGRFDLNYTLLSDEEIDMSKLAVDLDTTFKAWAVDVSIDASVSVETTAKSSNCTISTYSTVVGGDYTQMNNEKAILANYQKWLGSIEENPSLIGIKDINSLVPIWELLGDSDEEQERKAELQTIFEEYGQEAYEDLLESYEVNPPIRPMGVNVTVKDKVTGDVVDTNDVWAGSTLFLDVKAEPELAIISKSVTVDKPEYVTYNSADSSLLIKPETPHNEVINITVDVGYGVSAVIPITVGKYYTVTFESNDGTEIAPCTVRHGKQLSEPAEPIKTGFVFKGWYTDPDFAEDTLYVFGEKSITSNMTLYAKWEVYYPTISFVHNIVGCETLTDNVRYNNAYAQPALTNEGHNLLGCYSNEEMTAPFDFTQPIKGNTKIYVKWQPKEFTVTFDSQGGSSISAITGVKWNTKINTPVTPTKTGYEFGGWFRESACKNIFDFLNDTVKESMTLYASWLEDPIYIEFESNGEKVADTRKVLKGGSLGVNLPIINRNYYTFNGWYTSSQCLDSEKVYSYTTFTESCTLYAKWTAISYDIAYENNGGVVLVDGNYPATYCEGQTLIISDLRYATYSDYNHFLGWYQDENCNEELDINSLREDPRDITLYAKWELCTVYASIDATPWATDGRVIIDWSAENDTNLLNHTSRDVENDRYNNIDIRNGTKEVIFIGDPLKVYTNFRMAICNFEQSQKLTIRFKDFNFITDSYAAIGLYEDQGVDLTIEAIGECCIRTTYVSGGIIDLPGATLTVIGEGTLIAVGGNGADATTEGGAGGPGGMAIYAASINIDMEGFLNAVGGKGGDGMSVGEDASIIGGYGGNGGDAVACDTLRVYNASKMHFTGGSGGAGGIGGGNGWYSWDDYAVLPNGARGGDGGNGGAPIKANAKISVSKVATITLQYGNGGAGGKGGTGGNAAWSDNGVKPDTAGNGGNGGHGGVGFHGGKGGNGGAGGYSFANQNWIGKWQYGQSGSGGWGANGGDSMAMVQVENGKMSYVYGSVGAGGSGGAAGERGTKDDKNYSKAGVDRTGVIASSGNHVDSIFSISWMD